MVQVSSGRMPLNTSKKRALEKLQRSALARGLSIDEKTLTINRVRDHKIATAEGVPRK